jgi:hypothetical protein
VTFDDIRSRWSWRPIPHCPGRFVLSSGPTRNSPAEIVGRPVEVSEYAVPAAKDPVSVIRLPDGGMISFRKVNGTWLHTLNTPEGFERKLQQLGIR